MGWSAVGQQEVVRVVCPREGTPEFEGFHACTVTRPAGIDDDEVAVELPMGCRAGVWWGSLKADTCCPRDAVAWRAALEHQLLTRLEGGDLAGSYFACGDHDRSRFCPEGVVGVECERIYVSRDGQGAHCSMSIA